MIGHFLKTKVMRVRNKEITFNFLLLSLSLLFLYVGIAGQRSLD